MSFWHVQSSRFLQIGLLIVSVMFDLGNVKGQLPYEAEHKVRCDPAYCVDNKVSCLQVPPCTTIGFRTFLNPQICNCCDYCFNYLEEGDSCKKSSPGLPNTMCGPLLECVDDGTEQTCGTMTTGSCSQVLNGYNVREKDGTSGIADWLPFCTARGEFHGRQCLPASSVCICMNAAGEPIFGMGLSKDLQDCACSRHVDRLKSYGILDNGPHCLPNGDYDPLQCSLRERTCYCHLQPEKVVSMSQIKELPCYNETLYDHNEKYVRPCELQQGELDTVVFESDEIGSSILIGDFPRCDPDGNYAAIQSRKTSWVCVDPTGEQIDTFGVAKTTNTALEPPPQMNCLCARIRHFLGDNSGKPKCCSSGNFRAWQCTASKCYCVDHRGIQDMTADPVEVDKDNVADLVDCYGPNIECPVWP